MVAVSTLLDRISEPEGEYNASSFHYLWQLLSRERWVWATPLTLIMALYLRLIMQTQQAVAAPLLYRLF